MYNLSWIKLDINILDNKKIKLIRKMPEGDALIVLWLAVLTEGMKSKAPGLIYFPEGVGPDEYFSTIYDFKGNTVKMGLAVFVRFNMIELIENGLQIVGFNDHQALDQIAYKKSLGALRVAKFRAKSAGNDGKVANIEKAIVDLKNNMADSACNVTSELRNTQDKKRKEKKREEKNRPDPGFDLSDQFALWLKREKDRDPDDLSDLDRNELFVEFSKSKFFNLAQKDTKGAGDE